MLFRVIFMYGLGVFWCFVFFWGSVVVVFLGFVPRRQMETSTSPSVFLHQGLHQKLDFLLVFSALTP
jgi:hypothetical protein